jgi:preprotein translocase subunit YajC
MTKIIVIVLATALTALVGATAGFASGKVEHALVGSIEKVDKEGKTLIVKTADGTEETLKWTERTTVDGLKGAAKAVDLAGREGEHVVVRYSVEGADKTAVTVKRLGRATAKVAEGTIKSVRKGARTLVVKTGDGTEQTFHLAKRASVDSAKGIARGSESAAKEGEHVTVYFTEDAGRKVAHLLKRL